MVPAQGKATAYVCENYVCKLPTSDPEVLARLLMEEVAAVSIDPEALREDRR